MTKRIQKLLARSQRERGSRRRFDRTPRLEVVTTFTPGFVRLDLRGELDVGNVSELIHRLVIAERDQPALLMLDVREVTLVDASGLRVFLDAARRAQLHHRRFALTGADQETRRVLRLTALDQAIEVLYDPRD
jgi:anti-anti-sigma factor